MKFHHIGIACSDIERAIEDFGKFHAIVAKSQIVYDPLQKSRLCMVTTDTGLDVEFIAGEKVAGLVKKGITYYHICYEVENLEQAIAHYLSRDAKMISEPKPAILFGGRRVAFLYLPYGFVELLEE
jgi:methylmalonyl-CoA/ethylmalonyl-CoA epimerase